MYFMQREHSQHWHQQTPPLLPQQVTAPGWFPQTLFPQQPFSYTSDPLPSFKPEVSKFFAVLTWKTPRVLGEEGQHVPLACSAEQLSTNRSSDGSVGTGRCWHTARAAISLSPQDTKHKAQIGSS